MKKLILIILIIFILSDFVFAEQIAKTFTVSHAYGDNISWDDIASEINQILKNGWKIVSVTPFLTSDKNYHVSRTYKILVIFEKENK